MRIDFDKLKLEERRIILVATDRRYAELVQGVDWSKILKLIVLSTLNPFHIYKRIAEECFGQLIVNNSYLGDTFKKLSVTMPSKQGGGISDWFKSFYQKGEILIPHLCPADAARRYNFDLGGLEDGSVYVLNPCSPKHYLSPALYDERIAQEKLAAFLQIASALGAKKVELKSGEALSTERNGKMGVPLPNIAAQLGLNVSFKDKQTVDRQVCAEFAEPSRAPYSPPDLDKWREMDPTLDSMVKMRLNGQILKQGVSLSFGSTFGIASEITAKMGKLGLNVGGEYREVANSRWAFEVEFWRSQNSEPVVDSLTRWLRNKFR